MATIRGIKAGTTTITASYGGKSSSVTLQVTQISPTLSGTAVSGKLTYSGSAQNIGTLTYNGDGTASYFVSTTNSVPADGATGWTTFTSGATIQSSAAAATYYVFVKSTAGTNYIAVSPKLAFSKVIDKRPVTYTATNQSKTYDGTALSAANTASLTSGTLVSGHAATFTCSGSQTTAGSATKTLSSVVIKSGNTDVSSNYDITKTNGTLTVSKRPVTYTATNQSKTYDGTALSAANTASLTSGTLVSGHAATFTCTGSVGPNVGTGTKTLSSVVIKSGNTDVSSNYEISKSNGNLSITQKAVTITAGSTSLTYNGSAQSYNNSTQTGLVSGHTYTCTVTGSATNVGDAGTNTPSAATIKDAGNNTVTTNYSITYVNGKITITQKAVTVTAGSTSYNYNGSAQTYSSATASGLASTDHLHSYTVTGSATNVGDAGTNTVSAAKIYKGTHNGSETDVTSNYSITYVNGKITINKINPVVTLTGIPSGTIFDGSDKYVSAKANVGGKLYWAKNTAATTSSTNQTLTTSNANITGSNIKNNSDDYTFYWLFVPTDTTNYNNVNGNVQAIIDPRNISNVTASAAKLTYNGANQDFVVTITDGGIITTNDYTVSGHTSKFDAGDYTITITGRNNYTGTKTITGTMNKKAVTVTPAAASKTYDGTALTPSTASTSTLGTSDHLHSYTLGGSQTNVGNTWATVSNVTIYHGTHSGSETDVTKNYTVTCANTTNKLTVSARAIEYKATDQSKTYDGTALSAANTASLTSGTLVSGHAATFTCSGSQTTAGSATKTLSSVVIKSGNTDVSSNYDITKTNGTLTVNKFAITYTATNQSKTYDGTALTAVNTASTTSTLPSGHTATFTCTGSVGPNVGTGTKTLSGVVIKNSSNTDVSSSFTITKANGTLTITQKAVTITGKAQSVGYGSSPVTTITTSNYGSYLTTATLVSGHTVSCSMDAKTTSGTAYTTSVNAGTTGYYMVPKSVKIWNGSTEVTSNYNITIPGVSSNGSLTITRIAGNVSYSAGNAECWCTATANAMSLTDAAKTLTVSSAGASSSLNGKASEGGTPTCTIASGGSGWSISSDGKILTVKKDQTAGEFQVTIKATAPQTTNYNKAETTQTITIKVKEVVLEKITLTLGSNATYSSADNKYTLAYQATAAPTIVAHYNNGSADKDVTNDATTTFAFDPINIATVEN